MALKTYQGSCHCGRVRFEARIDLSQGTNRCNCSLCSKARSWFVTVKPEDLTLLAGAKHQTVYEWLPPGKPGSTLHFQFCKTCGVRSFGPGGVDAKKPDFYFINVAALDGVDADELAASLHYLDGRNDRYDQAPADTRLL